jgi:hypothetical protein
MVDRSPGGGAEMMTLVDPITDEEFIGYLTAMLSDDPWGEPAADLAVLDERSELPHA